MANSLLKVFVYGTLKNGIDFTLITYKTLLNIVFVIGQPNHYWLENIENGLAKFLTYGKTKNQFPLVIGTRYNVPFLLNKPGIWRNIKGEIYHVDEKMLSKLDILEDYPQLYDRQIQDIETPDG